MTIETDYCHHISAENYFLSPKMPVKDHSLAFRSSKTSFKPTPATPVQIPLSRKPREY